MRRTNVAVAVLVALLTGLTISCGADSSNVRAPENQTPLPPPTPAAAANVYAWPPLIPKPGDLVLKETTTGSIFNLRGEAITGPLAEQKRLLIPSPGVNMFWFAFSAFFPGAEIWGIEERVSAGTLPDEKRGGPACGGGIDCIPSLPNTGPPASDLNWTRPDNADARFLRDDDLVVGIFVDGVARAYPTNMLWWHEIVNDRIGDKRFSVTNCPLTGSSVVWDGREHSFGVSGNLFNSNLVMYDHQTRTLWSQLYMGGVFGEQKGAWLDIFPFVETSWKKWKDLHPDTVVLSEQTGFSRDYKAYPYGSYRQNHDDTFRATTPPPDSRFLGKELVFGLIDRRGGLARGYVHAEVAKKLGPSGVIHDEFNGKNVVIAFEQSSQFFSVFEAQDLKFAMAQFAP